MYHAKLMICINNDLYLLYFPNSCEIPTVISWMHSRYASYRQKTPIAIFYKV